MLEAEEIFTSIAAVLAPKILSGKRVSITAGPTHEAIDPVHVITNHSSGKMGYALADAARTTGSVMTLVSGPVTLAAPAGVMRVSVLTAREMFDAVKQHVDASDVFIAVAAVADYHVIDGSAQKNQKGWLGQIDTRIGGEPGHPGLRRCVAKAAVLRRLRGGEPGRARIGRCQAPPQEGAAVDRQSRASGVRCGRQ